jgi:hypothetical protein
MYCQPIKINLFCNQCIFLDLQMGWRRYVLIYFPTTIFVLRPARWNTLYLGGPRTSLQMDGTLHLISFFLKIFLEVGSIRNHVHPGGWGGGGRHIVVTRFFFRNAKICQNNHQKNYIFHPKLLEKVKIISNQLLIFQNDSSIQLALISYLKGMQDCSLLSIVLFKIYINQTLLKKGTLKMKKSHFPVTVLKYPSYSMVFL